MLNALANFSDDGFGGARLTDNSTIVGDTNSVSINNQAFMASARAESKFRNYYDN